MQVLTLTTLKGPDGVEIITYETTPDLKEWNCQQWMAWHMALADQYGLVQANQIFVSWWERLSEWGYNKNLCAYGSEFSSYMRDAGLNDIISFIGFAWGQTTKAVTDLFSSAQNLTAGTEMLTSGLTKNWIIGGLAVVGTAAGLWYLNRTTNLLRVGTAK